MIRGYISQRYHAVNAFFLWKGKNMHTINEVLDFVKDNDVKFIRLSFCDLFGQHKNIAIMANELPSAFESGISFDAHAVKGFRDITRSDLLLFPDPNTLTVLPWRPRPDGVVRLYCDIRNPDGSPFSLDSRNMLRQMVRRCESFGYVCNIGAESEFYLFKTDENGEPTLVTQDNGGYLDTSPLDKGESIRREICLTLEEMGLKPETSHHERGPGQNEIDFKPNNALASADNLITFKSVAKAIAARNGLFASFMPKPLPHAAGSGLHVNISLNEGGVNIFNRGTDSVFTNYTSNKVFFSESACFQRKTERKFGEYQAESKNDAKNENAELSKVAESFIAGILARTPEMTLFLNPLANSYERFGVFEAPKYVSWSHQNRSQLIRIPAAIGEKVRMELRSPDPSLNPYLAFTLIVAAGLDGVENKLTLPPPVDVNLYTADASIIQTLVPLPNSLDRAMMLAENSDFVKNVVGEELLSKFLDSKKAEAADFIAAEDKIKFYRERYFDVV